MNLRPYQRETIDSIKSDWAAGINNVMITVATGGGKTVIFLGLLAEELHNNPNKRCLIIAHRKELIEQPIERLASFWPDLALRSGIVMAEQDDCDKQIIVATVQTLNGRGRMSRILRQGPIDYIVTDECFVAGTLVDGKPIEDVKVGDKVTAFDEKTGTLAKRKVTRLFKNPVPPILVKIVAGGNEIVCTPEHPVLCNGKWTPARLVCHDDYMVQCTIYNQVHTNQGDVDNGKDKPEAMRSMRQDLYPQQLELDNDANLFGEMQVGSTGRASKSCDCSMCRMRQGGRVQGAERPENGWQGESLLLRGVQTGVQDKNFLRNDGKNQPQICQRTHEEKESHVRSNCQGEDENINEDNWFQGQARREWGIDATAGSVSECSGMGDRGFYSNGIQWEGRKGISLCLQGGHWERNLESSYRSGRQGAQITRPQRAGSKENRTTRIVRVDSVEILERGSDERFDRLCPDGFVYNLEVEEYHTYIANNLVVHNCHHSCSNTYLAVYDQLRQANPHVKHLGVTATPIRADGKQFGDVYEKVSAHYGIKELVKLGYLAPPRWLAIQTGISLADVPKTGSGEERDYSSKRLADVFETDNCFDLVVETHKKYAQARPAIAFTASVEGAYKLAEKFTAAGIPAGAADGTTRKETRAQLIKDFRSGKISVLCNVALWTEGLDLPEISCVHMVRPTQSDSYYVQCIGRGLRLLPGKDDALILDYAPAEVRNVTMLGDVLGVNVEKSAYMDEGAEEGAVIAGFTFDGDLKWMKGDPMEIIGRALDYLNLSPWRWSQQDKRSWMVLGMGKSEEDNIERTLAMSPAGEKMELWAVWKKDVDRWHSARLLNEGTFEELSEIADEMAQKWGNAQLARKSQRWHHDAPTEGQIKFARRLGINCEGLTKGAVADAITYKLTMDALRRGGAHV